MKRDIRILILILVGMLGASLGVKSSDGGLDVVATHSILADVATNVSGGLANVATLIPSGADPHAFIPSPGDLTTVAEADLVLINGVGYEESLLEAIVNAGESVDLVMASACIEILPFGAAMHDDAEHAHEEAEDAGDDHDDDKDHEGDDQDLDGHDDEHDDDGDQDDDHDDDGDHDEDEVHEGDDHDDDADHADDHDAMEGAPDCDDHDAELHALIGDEEDDHEHFESLGRGEDVDCHDAHAEDDAGHAHGGGACDPHVWMDPHNVVYWALKIRDALSAADPDNAAGYAANAESYARELVALESDFILPALGALPMEARVLVTSHESLGYFATTFGFEIVTTIVPGMATMVEPSARDIAALIDRVSAEGVPAMFSDTQSSDAIVRTIADAAGIKIYGIYSDTLTDSEGPAPTYLDYMRYNVTTIVDALRV